MYIVVNTTNTIKDGVFIMMITKEFARVWNSLAGMGFTPTMVEDGVIDITTYNTSDELDFAAAVIDLPNVFLVKVDKEENERYYNVDQFTVRVYAAF
jgi:hypothetical protein